MRLASLLFVVGIALSGCTTPNATNAPPDGGTGTGGSKTSSSISTGTSTGAGGAKDAGPDAPMDAPVDVNDDVPVPPVPDGALAHPCTLPGAVQFTTNGTVTVPGGSPSWPSLAFLHLPTGFCARYYGTVGNARQIRFAPGGELFVASPTSLTTGGGQNGQAAIIVLPDYDQDGLADAPATFISWSGVNKAMTQGMLFANGYFYYQDGTPPGTKIMRVPYAPGDLKPSSQAQQVADINFYTSTLHWPKTMDVADDGSIYVGNGGDQGETCAFPHPFHGGIVKIDAAPGGPNPNGLQVARGFRNPIAVRCAQGHNQCFALELALDYSAGGGGREKMVPIRPGDDWGFPCCATKDLPYHDAGATLNNCSGVSAETNSFLIGDTPFGVDFESGKWPGQWAGRAYVVTHGAAGSWTGARMVAIPIDPTSGLPMPSSNITGTDQGMVDFATGWDDSTLQHGRPAAVAFAPDGRLFVANDNNGVIFWIAPLN
jgi:glucose/arabinose dehydrogenase